MERWSLNTGEIIILCRHLWDITEWPLNRGHLLIQVAINTCMFYCTVNTHAVKGVARVLFFTEALAEFQHVNCMIVEVKRVACYARAETFIEAVASVASMPMVATPLAVITLGL